MRPCDLQGGKVRIHQICNGPSQRHNGVHRGVRVHPHGGTVHKREIHTRLPVGKHFRHHPVLDAKNVADLFREVPDALGQIIGRYGADAGEIGKAVGGVTGREAAIKTASDAIANPVAVTISNCIAFILIFAVVFLALVIVTAILDAVFHLPVLNGVNKAFGLIFGVAEALLFAWVISYVAAAAVRALGSVDPNTFGEHVPRSPIK